jgi:hypothetical protein
MCSDLSLGERKVVIHKITIFHHRRKMDVRTDSATDLKEFHVLLWGFFKSVLKAFSLTSMYP